jgi:predicted GNAT superfamily acetyltransferase
MGFHIRSFEKHSDFEQAEALQALTWSRIETVPSNILIAMTHHGALALGAFDETDRLLGLAFSFLAATHIPGAKHGLSHHSHMAAVRPELRGQGIGEALKRAQAKALLARGFNLMTWTYDPLEARNANLNIVRLGCVCRTYIRNCYGEMRDGLNAGLPSDRFEVEWWLEEGGGGVVGRPEADSRLMIEIPADFQAIKKMDMALALKIRLHTRQQFEDAFAQGYAVMGFAVGSPNARYLLAPISNH